MFLGQLGDVLGTQRKFIWWYFLCFNYLNSFGRYRNALFTLWFRAFTHKTWRDCSTQRGLGACYLKHRPCRFRDYARLLLSHRGTDVTTVLIWLISHHLWWTFELHQYWSSHLCQSRVKLRNPKRWVEMNSGSATLSVMTLYHTGVIVV